MLSVKIVGVGDYYGILLSKEMLPELGFNAGDWLHFLKSEDGYRVVKADREFVRQMDAAKHAAELHQDTIKRLGPE